MSEALYQPDDLDKFMDRMRNQLCASCFKKVQLELIGPDPARSWEDQIDEARCLD